MKKIILTSILLIISFSASSYDRVISTVPSITESIYAMGLGRKLVGISNFCKIPNGQKIIPQIGTGLQLNLEAIVKIKPDLVIMGDYSSDQGMANLKKLNIKVVKIPHNRLRDIRESFKTIGKLLGKQSKEMITKFDKSLGKVNHFKGKHVLVVISASISNDKVTNLLVANESSFYGDLVALLGGSNLKISSAKSFVPLGMEGLLKFRPEIIFDIGPDMKIDPIQRKKAWGNLLKTLGLKKTTLKIIRKNFAVIPGPKLGLLYKELRSAN